MFSAQNIPKEVLFRMWTDYIMKTTLKKFPPFLMEWILKKNPTDIIMDMVMVMVMAMARDMDIMKTAQVSQ